MKKETLCARFKTKEVAKTFESVFKDAVSKSTKDNTVIANLNIIKSLTLKSCLPLVCRNYLTLPAELSALLE